MSQRSRRVEEDALRYARAFNYVSLSVAKLRAPLCGIPRSVGRVNDLRNVSPDDPAARLNVD